MPNSLNDSAGNSTLHQSISNPKLGQQISLIDHTVSHIPEENDQGSLKGSHPPSLHRAPSDIVLLRQWTKTQIQQQVSNHKYSRYQKHRWQAHDESGPSEAQEPANPQSTLGWGKGKVKGLLKKKKLRQAIDEDAVIDVLYENQRGLFTLGVPHFSSNSLLNFDPKPWINAQGRTSPVNITNAQVPDPEWEWAWKSWYVDMSRDVDEDGWEYSLAFGGFSWHGNHPWFHSFVRRRRWLRKRVRKHAHHHAGKTPDKKHMSEAHMLTPEYFTIHPSKTRTTTDSQTPSLAASGALRAKTSRENIEDSQDIRDIATLLKLLKSASIDRQKLVLVRNFVQNASDELYYLQDQIPDIMARLVFQNSRRHLLEMLMEQVNAASAHRDEHTAQSKPEGDREKSRIDNLLKAVDAADREVRRLEYWSDIRRMVREGEAGGPVENSSTWPAEEWQGLEASGPLSNEAPGAKQSAMTDHEMKQEVDGREEDANRKHDEVVHEPGSENDEQGAPVSGSEAYETAEERRVPDVPGTRDMSIDKHGGFVSGSSAYETAEERPAIDKGKGRAVS
ncbi:hypothetical protein MBLNU457_1429t1 [Dothideomycetes sp. NU457]